MLFLQPQNKVKFSKHKSSIKQVEEFTLLVVKVILAILVKADVPYNAQSKCMKIVLNSRYKKSTISKYYWDNNYTLKFS